MNNHQFTDRNFQAKKPNYNSTFNKGSQQERNTETKLLPNEMRINSRGNSELYLNHALDKIK